MLQPKGTFRTYRKIKLEIKEKEKECHETHSLNHLNIYGREELVGIQVLCIGCCVRVQ
jgi:hypothetical protein